MGPQDRVDEVVRLAEKVVHERGRTDCRFVVLGDGECLEELRGLCRRLRLEPWVELTGWVDEEAVFSRLAAADVGVDTSLQEEVSPVKAMEYMAFGLPFVCFDLQETRRLADGAADLVPAGDLDGLADALLALQDDPARRRRLGAHGTCRVEQELAWERQVPGYLEAVAPGTGQGAAHPEGGRRSARRLRAAVRA
jgi:glycosyltransferase involved in cell wall biosynthesis